MDLFDLSAKITLDTKDYEREVKKAGGIFSDFGSKLKTGFATAAKVSVAAVGAAAAGVSAIVKSSVDAYADYEQLVGGVETLFGESADKVQEYAANAFKTAGLSANEYMETVTSFSASLLQSLGGDTQAAAEYADMAITDMSDNANKMGTSMESIQTAYQGFAKQNYTMLDNLKLGYGGTKSEMERLIQDAEKLDSSFKATRDENGDLAMSYADVVDAIHIVQTEMGITGTTAKEASTTISGSLAATKAAWQNLLVAFGSGKDVKNAIGNLASAAKTTVKNIIPVVKQALTGISGFVKEIGPIIIQELPGLIKELLPELLSAAVSLVGALIQAIPGILSALWETIKTLFSTFMSWLRGQNPELAGVLDGIIEAGKKVIGFFKDFKKNAEKIWEDIKKVFSDTWKSIEKNTSDKWNAIKSFLSTAWANIKSIASSAWNSIKSAITSPFETAKNTISTIASGIMSALSSAWESVKSTASAAWAGVKSAIVKPIEEAKESVSKIWDTIKGLFNGDIKLKIKLPTITLGEKVWKTFAGEIKIPWPEIKWNKIAMNNPMLFSGATIFGAGEAGDEVLYGRDSLMKDIKSAVKGVGTTINITVNAAPGMDEKVLADKVAQRLQQQLNRRQAVWA